MGNQNLTVKSFKLFLDKQENVIGCDIAFSDTDNYEIRDENGELLRKGNFLCVDSHSRDEEKKFAALYLEEFLVGKIFSQLKEL